MSVLLWTRRLFVPAALLVALPLRPASAGEAWVIQGAGAGHYATLQGAIDAAGDGGILIVGTGTYAPFVIDGKSIVLYAAEGANVEVAGTVEIKNITATKAVFLAGLTVTGAMTQDGSSPGLRLTNSLGNLRFRDCTFRGGPGSPVTNSCESLGSGSPGVLVDGSTRVAFATCTIVGGNSADMPINGDYECPSRDGPDGLVATASTLCLHKCDCTGGDGGNAGEMPGRGGRGCAATGNGFFASGTTFRGGRGGDAWDFVLSDGADGGDGLFLGANTGVHLLACTEVGGAGGHGLDSDGQPGVPRTGPGIAVEHPGASRWVAGPRIARDAASAAITFHGTQGDSVLEQGSSALDFHLFPGATGFRFILPPLTDLTTPAVIPAAGSVGGSLPAPDVVAPGLGTVLYTQMSATSASSETLLGNALDVVVLDRGGLPDCNGDGVLDYFDIQEGTSQDCDGNLVPDECDVAAVDCNANQVPDACDIQSGSSLDVDHDGIPDECQQPMTWYVDPAAPDGGDGSVSRPFRAIRPAIDASRSGDTVLLRDGLYTGVDSTGLLVGDPRTSLTIRSERGPAACTIDCQQNGRAFRFLSSSSQTFVLEGITIKNGRAFNQIAGGILISAGNVTIRNCVIQNCSTNTSGGGIYAASGRTIVEDCVFENNSAVAPSNSGLGGAIELNHGETSVVRRCRFTGNQARAGGAIHYHGQGPGGRLSHCSFETNVATEQGGALWVDTPSRTVDIPQTFEIDDCLFAGNTSTGAGGAVYLRTTTFGAFCRMRITSSTFSGNSASEGGAVATEAGSPFLVSNSIFWSDSATAGAEIALLAPVSTDPADMDIQFCDVAGGAAGIEVAAGTLQYGAGNLSIDPLFTASHELSGSSPCIDAGDNSAVLLDASDVDGDGDVNELVPWDLARRARFFEDPYVPDTGVGPAPIVDMGAFERWVPRRAHVRSHP